MANQVSFLKDLVGQQSPSLSDRLVFTEYEDRSMMGVRFFLLFHVDRYGRGAEGSLRVLVRSDLDRHSIVVFSLFRSSLQLPPLLCIHSFTS